MAKRRQPTATYETWFAATGIMGDGLKRRNALSLIRNKASRKIICVIEFVPTTSILHHTEVVHTPEQAVASGLIPRTWLSNPP